MIFGMAKSIEIDEYTLEDLALADIGSPDQDGVVSGRSSPANRNPP